MARATPTRRMLRLAIPALGALIAQPLFVATDTAMVGHLGEPVLAGLAIGSTIVSTAVGLMVFLAYATTPEVARRLGAGNRAGAIRTGIEGMWLGLGCGVALLLAGLAAAVPAVAAFTDNRFVADAALSYLTISLWGLPATLLSLAATGLLRGLQDTRTPLVISLIGAGGNIALNAVLIFGCQLGIAGSALGTVIAEWGMAAGYVAVATRAARSAGVSLRPGRSRAQLTASSLMMLRTLTLRFTLLALMWAGSQLGETALASLQVTYTVYNVLLFTLDALAIAAQAMVGHDLGAGNLDSVRTITRQMMWWGTGLGVVLGALVAALAPVLGRLFTADERILALLPGAFFALAATLPICGLVFALDGVLIGAGDLAYLAIIGVPNLLALLALLWLVLAVSPSLTWLWAAYGGGFMLVRAVTLVVRAMGERWMHAAKLAECD